MIDVRGLRETQALLRQYEGRELDQKLQKGTLVAARSLVKPMRAAAPKGTGALRRSIKARRGREDRPSAVVGPTARHRHLVIRGHRVRGHGPGAWSSTVTRPNPFVARAARAHEREAMEAFSNEVFKALR